MKSIVKEIATRLQAVYPADEAEALAWWIMEESTGLSRTQLQIGCKGTTNFSNLQEQIDRLLHFEPIQYIFGHTLWAGLDLKVTPATLIPRPETAELVEQIDRFAQREKTDLLAKGRPIRVLDIGTGSGCIAIALKKHHPEWDVTGIDLSEKAIGVAKENAVRNEADVTFLTADIFDSSGFNGHFFDLVVSNPPYICESEKNSMRRNVLDFEPASALFVPDEDPLLFYRRIASLRLGSFLFFEINEHFPDEIERLLRQNNYTDIQITNDIYGKPRIIEGRMVG